MTCIVCAAWFPFSVHILNGITSINLIFIHCSVPTQCPILCSVPHSLSTYSLSSSHISLMLSPGAGVWPMGQCLSLLWSQITGAWWGVTQLREFHCYTGQCPLTVPGTPASGHRDTGLTWHGRSLPHRLLLTHWPGLHWLLDSRPREQISHTQERSSYFGIEIEGCWRQILKMSSQRKSSTG